MRMPFELCLAKAGKRVPDGPDWIHEVKQDGYRMLVIRDDKRVRPLSRNVSTGPSDTPGSPRQR